jgi:hypothetical protein
MKRFLLTFLLKLAAVLTFAQVQSPSTGVSVSPTGFQDDFTDNNNSTTWSSASYGWYWGNAYNLSEPGDGFLHIDATNADPNYVSMGSYGMVYSGNPINITSYPKVTMVVTNTSTTDPVYIRIWLRGKENGDDVDINSLTPSNDANHWGVWIKADPIDPSSTATLTFDLSGGAYMEYYGSDNSRYPHNQCTSSSSDYYVRTGGSNSGCIKQVPLDSIFGMGIQINGGGNADLSSWPNYAPFTGTIKVDKITVGQLTATGVNTANNYIQNATVYPNPTSKESNIKLSLKNESKVKIDIKDATGIQVMNVLNDQMSEGDHIITTDISNLKNGFYNVIYQFEDGSVYADKLVVVK